MATSTYILSIDDFTNRTDLSPNIATNFLQGYYTSAQEKSLVAVICQETYNELIDQLSQGGEVYLDPEYTALLPFIKDYLVWATMEIYYPLSKAKSTPAGMRKHTDTISTEAVGIEIDIYVKNAESNKEFYQDKLVNFLEENKTEYPLWENSRCNNCQGFTKGVGGVRFTSKNSNKTIIKYT